MDRELYSIINTYEDRHWWYKGRRLLLRILLRKFPLKQDKTILDFGCGTGYMIDSVLKQYGTAYGVDIDAEAIQYCHDKGISTAVLAKDNKPLPFQKNFFSCITCLDVLEHIPDDGKILRQFHSVLQNDGMLVVFVPAIPQLWSPFDDHAHHQRRYTKSSLHAVLQANGFKIQTSGYYNFLFFIPIFLVRYYQRIFPGFHNTWGVNPVIGSGLINLLITFIFSIDIVLSAFLPVPVGVSLYVVATKNQ